MYALGSEHDSTVNVNVNEHDSTVKHGSCGHSGYAGSARPAGGYLISDDLKHLASRAAAACKCSPRRPLRTCALCMQLLTTALCHAFLMRAQHASAHHGAPLRTCAPCRARRAPRAAGRGAAASPHRDQTCREHLMRCNQMQSDAIRCSQMQSDAIIGGNQIPSDPIRSHQIPSVAIRGQSEPIRGHQSESEAIQSAERAVDVERADGALSGGQELSELHVAEHAASK